MVTDALSAKRESLVYVLSHYCIQFHIAKLM